MENQTSNQNLSITGLLKYLSVAFENLFVSDTTKDFRRWKNFLAS
jgi:hypothetical protein